jgi:hypothetical protein
LVATKKADVELKQAMSAATREYDKKQKHVKLEKDEREKAMNISDRYYNHTTCLWSACWSTGGCLLGGQIG